MKAATYYRQNKNWKNYLGKVGTVVVSTLIHVSSKSQAAFLPYSYAVVDFGSEKKEFMGVAHEELKTGDKVVCVLRKIGVPEKSGIIPYGIKIQKL